MLRPLLSSRLLKTLLPEKISRSHALVIRAPVLHHLFDGLALVYFSVQHFSCKCREFRAARETQRNDLGDREFADSRLQILRQKALISQTILHPDHPILPSNPELARQKRQYPHRPAP